MKTTTLILQEQTVYELIQAAMNACKLVHCKFHYERDDDEDYEYDPDSEEVETDHSAEITSIVLTDLLDRMVKVLLSSGTTEVSEFLLETITNRPDLETWDDSTLLADYNTAMDELELHLSVWISGLMGINALIYVVNSLSDATLGNGGDELDCICLTLTSETKD